MANEILAESNFNDELKNTVQEMVKVMYQDDGIGLAAPQVGISQRFLVIGKDDNKNYEVYINPEITFFSKNKDLNEEGCLSLPQIFGLVRRAKKIHVKYSVFKDKIMHKETQALVLMLNQEVPFKNITRITFSRSGFLNKLLDCGDITIDLTALNIKEVKLLSINNPEQVAQYLQGMLNNYNATQQMQFQEQKKIEGIMERF